MNKLIILLILLLFLLPLNPVDGQANSPTLIIEKIDWSQFPQIEIEFNLWQANGTSVNDLSIEQISVQEDQNIPLLPINLFPDQKTTLDVVLVLDVSGSMQGHPLIDARVAATRFLDRLETNDQAGLIAFSDGVDSDPDVLNPELERHLSNDIMPLYDLVDALEAGGATHLYNAAAKAVQFFEQDSHHRKAILLLSDGRNEPIDEGEAQHAIDLAQQAGIPFFVIGLGEEVDDAYLTSLATETGGLYRKAPTSAGLAQLFTEMADLLKTRYILQYTSQLPTDGAAHSIQLSVNVAESLVKETVQIGPLPTPIAEPTQLVPLIIITEVEKIITATPQPTPVPPPLPKEPEQQTFNWFWIIPIIVAAVALLLGLIFFKRKPKPIPEACARCGRDLTGTTGLCPDCGSEKRLKKQV